MRHEWMNVPPPQWTRFQTQNNRDQCFHSSVYQNHLGARVSEANRPHPSHSDSESPGVGLGICFQPSPWWVWWLRMCRKQGDEWNVPAFQEEQGKLRSESADLAVLRNWVRVEVLGPPPLLPCHLPGKGGRRDRSSRVRKLNGIWACSPVPTIGGNGGERALGKKEDIHRRP